MYSNSLKQLIALAKNISRKRSDHTCRCVNGSRSDGLWYRGDDPKSAAGRARWSRCSFSSFSFFFLFFFLLNFVWLFFWYQTACIMNCCSTDFLILLILLRSTPFLRSTKSWGGKSPQTHSAAREWLRWLEKKISHNLNNNIFSSETTGFEQQSTASKRRAAPHRTHWGEGGEQHRSLTRAGYHHHHHNIITIIIISSSSSWYHHHHHH